MVTVAQYPLDIPIGTGVPAWAYQNVSLADTWNQTLALPQTLSSTEAEMILLHEAPESTNHGTPTASVNYHISTGGGFETQTSATISQTSVASTRSSKSDAGPIAAGVVGGIIVLGLTGGLVRLLVRGAQVRSLIAYYLPGQIGEAYNYPTAVAPTSLIFLRPPPHMEFVQ
ncbi:hypothetical protein FS837_006996, partial [Tulasnella sp. UAMH 9824]